MGGCQTVDKADSLIVLESIYFFVFLATGAAEKHLISENRPIRRFRGVRGWYWREWSAVRKSLDFRRTAFPPREWRLCRHSHTCPLWVGVVLCLPKGRISWLSVIH